MLRLPLGFCRCFFPPFFNYLAGCFCHRDFADVVVTSFEFVSNAAFGIGVLQMLFVTFSNVLPCCALPSRFCRCVFVTLYLISFSMLRLSSGLCRCLFVTCLIVRHAVFAFGALQILVVTGLSLFSMLCFAIGALQMPFCHTFQLFSMLC